MRNNNRREICEIRFRSSDDFMKNSYWKLTQAKFEKKIYPLWLEIEISQKIALFDAINRRSRKKRKLTLRKHNVIRKFHVFMYCIV